MEEVAHLTRLKHAHVVRVIGTYIIGQELSILLYPVAQCNLEIFLLQVTEHHQRELYRHKMAALPQFMSCLSNTLAYIHRRLTKHMDIKPQNILVRELMPNEPLSSKGIKFKVYVTDFGISRNYNTDEATETEGPTMFTRRYAAPEVVDQDKRGLPADVFSLGCVFAEMVATLAGSNRSDDSPVLALRRTLRSNGFGDSSYQANIDGVHQLMDTLSTNLLLSMPYSDQNHDLYLVDRVRLELYTNLVKRMTDKDPIKRPRGEDLVIKLRGTSSLCCVDGPDELMAAPPDDG
jgi:serine/threonine protein kinase